MYLCSQNSSANQMLNVRLGTPEWRKKQNKTKNSNQNLNTIFPVELISVRNRPGGLSSN